MSKIGSRSRTHTPVLSRQNSSVDDMAQVEVSIVFFCKGMLVLQLCYFLFHEYLQIKDLVRFYIHALHRPQRIKKRR